MPQYLSPGVYVEEVPSTARPIAGVGTSTAGFIGEVADVDMPLKPGRTGIKDDGKTEEPDDFYNLAPIGEPRLVTSWEQFKNSFGDIQTDNQTLAQAVYGFFNNGGTRCWVIRLAPSSSIKAGEVKDTETKSEVKGAEAKKEAKIAPVSSTPNLVTRTGEVKDTETKSESKDSETKNEVKAAAGSDNLKDALARFAAIDEIAIVAFPGAVAQAQHQSILEHCFNLKDRSAILDGFKVEGDLTPGVIAPAPRTEVGSYGAVYFPWIKVADPSGKAVDVPPSGHIAGIYARNDATRGVHKAPANEVVLGALGLTRLVSKAEQDGLNPEGVNVIRSLNGAVTVWGARTRADEAHSDFKYVSTRRFFNFLRKSIDQGTQWVVFEPNTPALWQSITRNVTAFLMNVWRAGALFGNTPQQAFYVKCDADTNAPDQRELGWVVIEVGVAIVRPAEFVIFRIGQWAGPGK